MQQITAILMDFCLNFLQMSFATTQEQILMEQLMQHHVFTETHATFAMQVAKQKKTQCVMTTIQCNFAWEAEMEMKKVG